MPDGPGRLVTPDHEWQLDLPAPYERLLAGLPLATEDVVERAESIGQDCSRTLRVLADLGVLEDCVVDGAGQAVLVAQRSRLTGSPCRDPLRLHEHAFLRPGLPGWWILQRAGLPTAVRIDGSVVDLGRFTAAVPVEQLGVVGTVLLDAGFLDDGVGPEKGSMEFHDAVFHSVSALGETTEGGYGARRHPKPAPQPTGSPCDQRRAPDPAAGGPVSAGLQTPPLHEVLAARRSCRTFTAEPVPSASVDGLLALALRARGRHPQAAEAGVLHAYPSAGARDEITTIVASAYPNATLSRYLHEEHLLLPLDATADNAREVLRVLCRPCGIVDPLPALALVFAADYHRVAAKYEAIAYANILRDVGAIYQTVSLAATALGLGSCAVGGGWAHLERHTLAGLLAGRLIVGGMLIGIPAAP